MHFCCHCGSGLTRRVPEGDTRLRDVCDHCLAIHYENPKIVAGCLVSWEGRVLLCRRAIEPRRGFWTLPAGFMENEETTREAAVRETWEEARARVDIDGLYTLFNAYAQKLKAFADGKKRHGGVNRRCHIGVIHTPTLRCPACPRQGLLRSPGPAVSPCATRRGPCGVTIGPCTFVVTAAAA